MLVFQNAEHAAAIDARKLAIVADHNQLRARRVGVAGELGHKLGVDHRGFVEDDGGFVVPARAAIIEFKKLAVDRGGAREAAAAHVLGNGIGGGEADNLIACDGVGLANGVDRVALAGSGLSVDERKPPCPGHMAHGLGLLAAHAREFHLPQNRLKDRQAHLVPVGAGEACGGA
jgi:hypothetical protein